MRTQARISSLIILTILLVLVGIFFLWQTSRTQEGILLVERKIDKKFALDKVLETESLKDFANEIASLSDMTRFVNTVNRKWARENLETVLPVDKAQVIWVFGKDFSPVYSFSVLKDMSQAEIPLTSKEMADLFVRSRFPYFFVRTSQGIMEIRGAPIQPTGEKTPPAGYLFVGRLWTQEFLQAKAYLAGGELRLQLSGEEKGTEGIGSGVIFFTKPLPGWNGKPVMWLSYRSEDPLVVRVVGASMQAFILSGVFSLTILSIISIVAISLIRWVSFPLKKINRALDTRDFSQIKKIAEDGSEVSRIANFIILSQEQNALLEKEVLSRKMAEEKLESAITHIERAKKQWEDTFDNISDPIFIHDSEFRIIRANKAYASAAGMTFQDIIGRPYNEVFPVTPEPREDCIRSAADQREGAEEYFYNKRMYRVRHFPTVDLSGELKHSIHIMEDITEARGRENNGSA